eukprot:m.38238 g.38238  ORF g.38238 m.38238 type:complete len:74 (+) comp32547_c0_seq1:356-577(+)
MFLIFVSTTRSNLLKNLSLDFERLEIKLVINKDNLLLSGSLFFQDWLNLLCSRFFGETQVLLSICNKMLHSFN